MKINFEFELTCVVDGFDSEYWKGYKFYPGFIYDNKFYNTIWKHTPCDLIESINDMTISHEVIDESGSPWMDETSIETLCFKDIEDENLKSILKQLMEEAYADYLINN